jgi:hypothetical protein
MVQKRPLSGSRDWFPSQDVTQSRAKLIPSKPPSRSRFSAIPEGAPPIPSAKSLKSAQAAIRYNRPARSPRWDGSDRLTRAGGVGIPHVHSLSFERLEARQLLSNTHVAVGNAAPALVFNGTLTVDNNPGVSSTIRNGEGLMTTKVPVAGQLGTVGQVYGKWEVTVDAHGSSAAPDELALRDSKGSFVVAFTPPAHPKEGGGVSYERPQVVLGGTGAYAKASETGSVEVTTDAAGTQVVRLTLQTRR